YYRLQQLDENGKSEYSSVVSVVNTEALTSEIAAYPNPFNDKLTVTISDAKAGVATIEVMDLSGRLMYAVDQTIDNGNQTITINELSNLSQGVYFVRISTSGNTKVVKMIKQ
ncbi:MAG: T9SS type A sorting domain-containing protein, partial [Bacteroidia bacterium]|nr:T9SS type A sorting domain-containing protein [Bacteroidia bacterium]